MIVTKKAMSRRTVLRGIGTTVALPLLDAMVPALTAVADTPAKAVPRLGVVYHPNGVIYQNWLPKVLAVSLSSRLFSRRSRRSGISWSSSRGSPVIRRRRSATAAATTRAPQGRT